jgi:MinD-like ATPase involved in chromosome partitioning or flagellar assembly
MSHSGPKRIITIASGKGGVGKTTLAINYGLALSQYGKTVLFDFDFETGSVRSFLDMTFARDLYHFFVKDVPLQDCVSPLSKHIDPAGRYPNFGVIAAPRHYMEDFAHLKRATQHKLIQAIHKLDADYVILDMKAGLDTEILDFMPFSNSGILIFTPRLLAATSAAAYLVKAQIFRKLQILFSPSSPIVETLPHRDLADLFDLFHRADDVYDQEIPNLDKVYEIMQQRLGNHPVVTAIKRMLGTFQIHYVLNHFTGVQESYKKAIEPFAKDLAEIVSSRLRLRNLGWVQYHDAIHDANCMRVPILLGGAEARKSPQDKKVKDALLELEGIAGHLLKSRPVDLEKTRPGLDRYLADQLTQLEATYSKMSKRSHTDNFNYIAAASIHLMKWERPYHFGDMRILEPRELQQMIMESYRPS